MNVVPKLVALTLLLTSGSSHGQTIPDAYTLVELQPLGGGSASFVQAINDRGEIVGRTEFGTGPIATRWDVSGAASLITIDSGGSATDATSINDEGSILVACTGCAPAGVGVRLSNGTLLQIATNGGSVARRLNAQGSVGGLREQPNAGNGLSEYFGVVWEFGTGPAMERREYGPIATVQTGFSTIAGGLLSDSGRQAFDGLFFGSDDVLLFDSRTESGEFFSTGDDVTYFVRDINAVGQFVVFSASASFIPGATFYEPDGTRTTIPYVNGGFVSSSKVPMIAEALNDAGVVVGYSDIVDSVAPGKVLGRSAFRWSAETETVDLATLVLDGSADGWSLIRAASNSPGESIGPKDITNSGIIVGNGINPDGEPAAYVLIPRAPCAADANRDGVVNPADFNGWVRAFNMGCDG